jgi:PAP2 superfamily
MKTIQFIITKATIFTIIAFGFSACDSNKSEDSEREAFLRWNKIAVDTSGLDHMPSGESAGGKEQLGPVRSARAMAIVHIAMADAVSAVTKDFRSYLPVEQVSDDISVEAAIAQAARDTLVSLFPSQARRLNSLLNEDLERIGDDLTKSRGIALGKKTATAIIEARTNDGSELSEPIATINYTPKDDAGNWRKDPLNPDQPVLGSNWNKVIPFVLDSASQFRLPPPPALDSAEYAAAFEEAKVIGGDGIHTPTNRTEEQTDIGIFWAYDGTPSLCAPPRLYNQIASQLIEEQGLTLSETARLLALVNTAMADAGIAIWDSKYFYEFWRPITGIREADQGTGPTGAGDGNETTDGDKHWTPLGAPASNEAGPNFTPPFPAYPSGHAGFGGALFQVLRRYFKTDNMPFTFVSDELDGKTKDNQGNVRPLKPRSFDTLSQAEEENAQSRIYLGIHWSFDATSGISLGREVGDQIFDSVYQPLQ